MAQKQDKINGTAKVILLRLDNIDNNLNDIKCKLSKMSDIQTGHSIVIKEVEMKQISTDNNLKKHEEEHNTFAGLVVSASGVISAIIMFIITLFIKNRQ